MLLAPLSTHPKLGERMSNELEVLWIIKSLLLRKELRNVYTKKEDANFIVEKLLSI